MLIWLQTRVSQNSWTKDFRQVRYRHFNRFAKGHAVNWGKKKERNCLKYPRLNVFFSGHTVEDVESKMPMYLDWLSAVDLWLRTNLLRLESHRHFVRHSKSSSTNLLGLSVHGGFAGNL